MSAWSDRAEAALLGGLFALCRALPLDIASAMGGRLGRTIGPWLPAHRIAQKNIAMALPDLSEAEKKSILSGMWDNLGRVGAELPHLPGSELYGRVTVHGMQNMPAAGRPVIFFSGHLGNWELTYPVAHRHGIPVTLIYRHINNPQVDAIVAALRAAQSADMLPKGPKGAVRLGRALRNGSSLAMLVDQKMNEGIAVPFFGRDAMTAPAIAELALRYDLPIIPACVVRTHGCRFEATVYPPLQFEKTGDDEKDVRAIMTQINALLEGWIRAHPEQWFWVHRRWPREG